MARILSLVLVLLCLAPARAQPLPTDPRPVTGRLDSGLAYIIQRHNNPPGRAAVWLHISTGSLNETDSQRGLAHFLEHMAFNGSEHFPPGSVIPFFQSLGLTFGQHQNASTGFDRTIYQLELPDAKPETLDKSLQFLSDVAFRLTLPAEEIERERQVILEERRSRLGSQQRLQEHFLEHVAPGSLLGKRLPIGTEDVISKAPREELLNYYKTWYTPSNMTLMIVADADPAAIVEQVKTHFGTPPAAPRPEDQPVGVRPYDKTRAIIATDAELTSGQVGLVWIGPPEPPATTVPLLRRDLVDSMAAWMFNRRLEQKVAEGKVAFQDASAGATDLFHAGLIATIAASGEPSKWQAMLTDLATELQRARLNGFTDQELGDARKALLAAAERGVETEPTRSSRAILSGWAGAVTAEEPITSAGQDLELAREILPTITAAEVGARFNQLFDTARPVAFNLTLPSSGPVPSEADLIAAGRAALEVRPQAEAAAARPSSLMPTPPAPGKVVEESEHAASGVWSAWLENGVRIHHRFMDYKKDQVIFEISLAGGEIQETASDRGITQAAVLAWARPATSTLNSTAIRDLMTGRKVGVTPRPGMDQTTLTVSGSPEDIETGLQLAHLLLTDPVIEQASFEQWQVQQRIRTGVRKQTVEGVFSELLVSTLYPPGEARVRPLEIEQIDALTRDAAQARLAKLIATSPIEVAIVGDMPRERAAELARTYLGSLPARERISRQTLAELRAMERPEGPLSAEKSLKTKTDKAMVLAGFFGTDASNLRDTRLLSMASRVLTSRAITTIREEKQLAYSPSVNSSPALEFPGHGVFLTASYTAPDKTSALVGAIRAMYDDFAKSGPTPEELDTAKRQTANTMDEYRREPSYWVNAMSALSYRTTTLDDVMAAPEQYQSFTADEIREAFCRYYTPEATFSITVIPTPEASPAPAQAPAGEPQPPAPAPK